MGVFVAKGWGGEGEEGGGEEEVKHVNQEWLRFQELTSWRYLPDIYVVFLWSRTSFSEWKYTGYIRLAFQLQG